MRDIGLHEDELPATHAMVKVAFEIRVPYDADGEIDQNSVDSCALRYIRHELTSDGWEIVSARA
jgi:hypothetical protein